MTTATPTGVVLLLEGVRRGIYPLSTLPLLQAKAPFPFGRRWPCYVASLPGGAVWGLQGWWLCIVEMVVAVAAYLVRQRLPFVLIGGCWVFFANGSAPSSLGERGMGSPLRQQRHFWLVSVRDSEVLLSRGDVGAFFCRFFFMAASSGSFGPVLRSSLCLLALSGLSFGTSSCSLLFYFLFAFGAYSL